MRNLKSRILTVDLYLSDEEYAILKKLVEEQRRSRTAEVLAEYTIEDEIRHIVWNALK